MSTPTAIVVRRVQHESTISEHLLDCDITILHDIKGYKTTLTYISHPTFMVVVTHYRLFLIYQKNLVIFFDKGKELHLGYLLLKPCSIRSGESFYILTTTMMYPYFCLRKLFRYSELYLLQFFIRYLLKCL